MDTAFEDFLAGRRQQGEFRPFAWYYAAMDMLIVGTEDCTEVGEFVDERLTLNRHSSDERIVGFRLNQFRRLFRKAQEMLNALPHRADEAGLIRQALLFSFSETAPKDSYLLSRYSKAYECAMDLCVRYRDTLKCDFGVLAAS